MDPETLGLLASIGIEKGKPFAPDERMKKILTEAAAVGNATARTHHLQIAHQGIADLLRTARWSTAFVGGSYEFLHDGARLLDPYASFFFVATGITPAMSMAMVGVGSQYAAALHRRQGHPLDGGKTYKLRLPADIPAKDFWSLVLYDTQTRSELQTDQQFPSLGSQKAGLAVTPTRRWMSTSARSRPPARRATGCRRCRAKGWFMILRLYGPLEPWFDKTWQPGEIEEMK